jgi:hypothetical protein
MNDFIEKLEVMVLKDMDATVKTERSSRAYDNPNWAYKQAHTNGYLKALSNVAKFIDQYKQKQKEKRVDRLIDDPNKPIITGPPEPGSYQELPQ